MSASGLGRVKTPTFNQRIEIPSRFRRFQKQKCLQLLLEDDRKTILRTFGACTFLRSQGQSRQFDDVRVTCALPRWRQWRTWQDFAFVQKQIFAKAHTCHDRNALTCVFCRELPLQRKSNSQGDLVMANRPIFNVASRLHDFEPFHIANGL